MEEGFVKLPFKFHTNIENGPLAEIVLVLKVCSVLAIQEAAA